MLRQILLSLLKTLTVSGLISATGWYFFNLPPVDCGVVAFISQIAFFYIWNSYIEYRLRYNESVQETARIESYNMQGVEARCAHCNSINFIPIRFDDNNQFQCTECDKTNSVYIDVTIAQSADVLNKKAISVGNFNGDRQSAINELKNDR